MKPLVLITFAFAAFMTACNSIPVQTSLNPTRVFGVLELSLNSDGASTARFASDAQTRAVTFRENDVVFGTGITQVISSTQSAFDYLVATFPVSHAPSSTTGLDCQDIVDMKFGI
jgi:hypothetical protein